MEGMDLKVLMNGNPKSENLHIKDDKWLKNIFKKIKSSK